MGNFLQRLKLVWAGVYANGLQGFIRPLWQRHKTHPIRWIAIDLVVLAVLGLLFWPVPYEPVSWTPKSNPYGQGVWAQNDSLARAKTIKIDGAGAEGIAIGPDGLVYMGLNDGRIVRVRPTGDMEVLANTGGRPLGVEFDAQGNLIIADAYKGLLQMTPDGRVRVLTDSYQGERMIFVDDLAISRDGRIWFSDASTRFDLHGNLLDLFENKPSGRVFVYNPDRDTTALVLDGLAFANGVALSPDEDFLLVNETFRHKVTRFWLSGPKRGVREAFMDGLPGYPDNITRDAQGRYWIALVAPRSALLDALMPWPFLRKAWWRFAQLARINPVMLHSWAVAVDSNGSVLYNLEDATGRISMVTSVLNHEGQLYIGTLVHDFYAQLSAP